MRSTTQATLLIGGLLCSLVSLQLVHDLKWPAQHDRYREVARATNLIRPIIAGDSLLNIHVTDIPDDLFLYLRYCFIPMRVQVQPNHAAGKELLIASKERLPSAAAELRAGHPASSVLLYFEDSTTGYCLFQY